MASSAVAVQPRALLSPKEAPSFAYESFVFLALPAQRELMDHEGASPTCP